MKETDTKKHKFINAKRRGFMQGTAVASAATATGLASAVVQASDVEVAELKPKTGDRYKDSDYARAYYKKARF